MKSSTHRVAATITRIVASVSIGSFYFFTRLEDDPQIGVIVGGAFCVVLWLGLSKITEVEKRVSPRTNLAIHAGFFAILFSLFLIFDLFKHPIIEPALALSFMLSASLSKYHLQLATLVDDSDQLHTKA